MLKTLATVAGMILMVSSFALAGQGSTKPNEQPRAAQSLRSETHTQTHRAKKHHKHHKKHHAQVSNR